MELWLIVTLLTVFLLGAAFGEIHGRNSERKRIIGAAVAVIDLSDPHIDWARVQEEQMHAHARKLH